MRAREVALIMLALGVSVLVASGCGDGERGGAAVTTSATVPAKPIRRTAAPAGETPAQAPASTAGLEVVVVSSTWASDLGGSIPALVDAAGLVFVGEVVELKGQSNAQSAAGPRPGVPVSSFAVRVGPVAAGDLAPGSLVTVDQVGGVITRSDGSQALMVLESDELLEVGSSYLFFATEKPTGELSSPPFARFKVLEDGTLQALPDWASVPVVIQLSGLTVEGAFDEIRSSINY